MEEKKDEEDSTLNEGEAAVAIAHAKRLVDDGVQATNIGIIAPYAAQVCLNQRLEIVKFSYSEKRKWPRTPFQVVLLKMLKSNENKLKDMEISTVDGFQGREKEVIIISMVRSNTKKEVLCISVSVK